MANNTWKNYTQKNTALSDNDEVMLLDSTDEKNKRGLMSKFWDYVVDKMSTAVISKLETENKTVIGALNYLNGKSWKYETIIFTNVTIPAKGYVEYSELTRKEGQPDIPKNVIFAAISYYGSNDPRQAFVACSTYLFGAPMTITEMTITFVYV